MTHQKERFLYIIQEEKFHFALFWSFSSKDENIFAYEAGRNEEDF